MPNYFIKWCKKGHRIIKQAEIKNKNCAECGSIFISICSKCNAPLRDNFFSQAFFGSSNPVYPPTRPNNCSNCGNSYPWASIKIVKIKEFFQWARKLSLKVKISITTAIFIIAAIFGILNDGFGILDRWKPKLEKNESAIKETPQTNNLTTYNQSGGIAANNLILKSPRRHLNIQLKSQLDNIVKETKDKKVILHALLGDSEAYQFASEIKIYLQANGFQIDGIMNSFFSPPIVGQTAGKNNEGIVEIRIGSRE